MSFVNIKDILNGTAEAIESATVAFLDDKSLEVNPKLAALGSDGASVMVGRKTGVATRMRQRNPMMLNVHCVAHRLALAAAQAMEGVKYLQRLSNILQQLYYYYQNSAVRMAGLKEIEVILAEPQIKLKQAKSVRWLSHQRAVDAVRKTLPVWCHENIRELWCHECEIIQVISMAVYCGSPCIIHGESQYSKPANRPGCFTFMP
ncbi:zinc finger protein 862-like [Ptychodera flava]|uniref:zinc finger protein 862-like n=1 Tax=Ptychodera flava TaxID=63121 RepID=UPI003969CB76